MRRQILQIGLIASAIVLFSALAFSSYSKPAVTVFNDAGNKEAQKSSEMIFEKLVKRFIGAVSVDY